MRVKTDERRRAILDAATDLFHEVGYERASMAAISARVGGSKQTLYSYFPSKDDLFAAAMVAAMEDRGWQVVDLLDPETTDLRATLERFGRAYLDLISEPELISNTRVAIGTAGSSHLGAELYQLGPRRLWGEIAEALQKHINNGQLDAPSAEIAALHLKGLLEAGFNEPALFGADPLVSKDEAVARALDAYFKAYSP
jgi:AcrR family transcriptional regulator